MGTKYNVKLVLEYALVDIDSERKAVWVVSYLFYPNNSKCSARVRGATCGFYTVCDHFILLFRFFSFRFCFYRTFPVLVFVSDQQHNKKCF